jgi:hypothetical protein
MTARSLKALTTHWTKMKSVLNMTQNKFVNTTHSHDAFLDRTAK